MEIRGYQLLDKLDNKDAGTCQWCFCKKNGREYFLKQFAEPKYMEDSGRLSQATIERSHEICREFENEKNEYYSRLKRCRTGNVVYPIEFFREGSYYYLITDKVRGCGTDPGIISKLSSERKYLFLRALSYSLAAVHREGLVHGDLRPANVIIKKTDMGYYTAKLIDFDAGYISGSKLEPEEIQGDMVYYAPESYLVLYGESDMKLTGKVDIFALGLMFHMYWTNSLPGFNQEDSYPFLAALNENPFEISSEIPSGLRLLIKNMLNVQPEERPDADEVLRRLAGLAGESVSNSDQGGYDYTGGRLFFNDGTDVQRIGGRIEKVGGYADPFKPAGELRDRGGRE